MHHVVMLASLHQHNCSFRLLKTFLVYNATTTHTVSNMDAFNGK